MLLIKVHKHYIQDYRALDKIANLFKFVQFELSLITLKSD